MRCLNCGEADAWKVRELSECRMTGDVWCGCTTCGHRWRILRDGSIIVVYEGNEVSA